MYCSNILWLRYWYSKPIYESALIMKSALNCDVKTDFSLSKTGKLVKSRYYAHLCLPLCGIKQGDVYVCKK